MFPLTVSLWHNLLMNSIVSYSLHIQPYYKIHLRLRKLRGLIDWGRDYVPSLRGSRQLVFALLKKLLFGDVDILCTGSPLPCPANRWVHTGSSSCFSFFRWCFLIPCGVCSEKGHQLSQWIKPSFNNELSYKRFLKLTVCNMRWSVMHSCVTVPLILQAFKGIWVWTWCLVTTEQKKGRFFFPKGFDSINHCILIPS